MKTTTPLLLLFYFLFPLFVTVQDSTWHLSIAGILPQHRRLCSKALFTPDGQSIITNNPYGVIRRSTISTEPTFNIPGVLRGRKDLDLSPDGKCLAIGTEDGIVQVVNLETKTASTFKASIRMVNSIDFSPDGKWLLTSSTYKSTTKLWS